MKCTIKFCLFNRKIIDISNCLDKKNEFFEKDQPTNFFKNLLTIINSYNPHYFLLDNILLEPNSIKLLQYIIANTPSYQGTITFNVRKSLWSDNQILSQAFSTALDDKKFKVTNSYNIILSDKKDNHQEDYYQLYQNFDLCSPNRTTNQNSSAIEEDNSTQLFLELDSNKGEEKLELINFLPKLTIEPLETIHSCCC